jgi:hypothetical protein
MYRWVSIRLPGLAIVVNFVVRLAGLPAVVVAETVVVYVVV